MRPEKSLDLMHQKSAIYNFRSNFGHCFALVAERVRLTQSDAGQLDWRKNRHVADDRRETLIIK